MGETLTAIISAQCQTAALVAGATTISSNLLDKRSPRIGAIIFGFLIWFAAFLIPDPNAPITNAPWTHNWIHVYCNHYRQVLRFFTINPVGQTTVGIRYRLSPCTRIHSVIHQKTEAEKIDLKTASLRVSEELKLYSSQVCRRKFSRPNNKSLC